MQPWVIAPQQRWIDRTRRQRTCSAVERAKPGVGEVRAGGRGAGSSHGAAEARQGAMGALSQWRIDHRGFLGYVTKHGSAWTDCFNPWAQKERWGRTQKLRSAARDRRCNPSLADAATCRQTRAGPLLPSPICLPPSRRPLPLPLARLCYSEQCTEGEGRCDRAWQIKCTARGAEGGGPTSA